MKVRELIAELKKKPKFAQAYEDLDPQFQIAREVLRLRIELGMTQQQLAHEVGTAQSNISRLETGVARPSLSFLKKLAKALGADLRIQFVRPQTEATQAEADILESIPVLHLKAEIPQTMSSEILWLNTPTERCLWDNQLEVNMGDCGSSTQRFTVYRRPLEAA